MTAADLRSEFDQGTTDDYRRLKRKVTQRCDTKWQSENEGVAAAVLGITQGNAVETCVIKMGLIRAQKQNDRPECERSVSGRVVRVRRH